MSRWRVVAPDRDGADPVGRELGRVLLVERLAVDAVREARHHDWSVPEVRQQPRRDGAVVLDQVALGVLLVLPEDLLQVREAGSPWASEPAGTRAVGSLCRSCSLPSARGSPALCPLPSALVRPLPLHLVDALVLPQAQERRMPQHSLGRPLGVAHLAHVLAAPPTSSFSSRESRTTVAAPRQASSPHRNTAGPA